MTLYTVKVVATLTGGATEDLMASTAFEPSGSNEVQLISKLGGNPRLVGISSNGIESAAAGSTTGWPHWRISMNTWTQAQYIYHIMRHLASAETTVNHHHNGLPAIEWLPAPWELDEDADFTIYGNMTSNAQGQLYLYLSYGAPLPYGGGKLIWRRVVPAADVTPSATAWTVLGTITDLDPRINYVPRILLAQGEDKALYSVALTSTNNIGFIGGPASSHVTGAPTAPPIILEFVHDSIIIAGKETTSIYVTGEAVGNKPICYVAFEEWGGGVTEPGTSGETGGTGGAGGPLDMINVFANALGGGGGFLGGGGATPLGFG